MAEQPYPKIEYVVKRDSGVLQCNRIRDKVIEVPRELPCNVILVHGVNDVGTGYNAAEEGICAGLQERLFRYFTPGQYRMPSKTDKGVVEDDPDAIFFKRTTGSGTDSPVIPFYWGYREIDNFTKTVNGQKTDRYGTRLDKDLSKGGGPFGNATSSLPDMWNRGLGTVGDPVGDPLRPLMNCPGRMYMVLAAQRLAALIGMIRKFEPNDTVNIVAHSQGCLLSLLAQAFLMERGERTADTLILTHPPYSLDEELGIVMNALTLFRGGTDKAMEPHYKLIDGRQSLHARLQTLVNIVAGVVKSKTAAPAFANINESDSCGMVAGCWKPEGDRDNRGKVYLYFCPEDMTVALDNMRGIGWQGVPDFIQGTRYDYHATREPGDWGYVPRPQRWNPTTVTRKPMSELGTGFLQRVFTVKQRLGAHGNKPVPVMVGQPPHDFALSTEGEDGHLHVAASVRHMREALPVAKWPTSPDDKPETQRYGVRTINGEALHVPYPADLRGNQIEASKIPASSRLARVPLKERGPCEEVDPITAAIAVTGSGGKGVILEEMPVAVASACPGDKSGGLSRPDCDRLQAAYNAAKRPKKAGSDKINPDDNYSILSASRRNDGTIVAYVAESPNAARQRWQHELGEKSFHSAIFASRENHRRVTAYDLAIGSGKASSHPKFHAYLCAVADWRLKEPTSVDRDRKGILTWERFLVFHSAYYVCEPDWRKQLIEGNVEYYSTGDLPSCLPLLTSKLWDIVISETTSGKRVNQPAAPKGQS